MTTETEGQQTDEQAEASFAAGFARASGNEPEGDATAGKPEAAPEDKPEAAHEDQPPVDEWEGVPQAVRNRLQALESIPSQISKLAGHVGGFKSQLGQLESAITAAKQAAERRGEDAPTKQQVQEAAANPEAWANFKQEFPEIAEAVHAKLAADIAASREDRAPPVDVDDLRSQVSRDINQSIDAAEERALVRLKHPGWKATVQSPEFSAWFSAQPDELRALGASDLADDAIRVLDAYEQHRTAQSDADAARLKQQQRLSAAVTPTGSPAPVRAGISDEEAFARGFKRAARRA